MEFFNDVTAVVPGQTGAKPPRREIRAGPNKRCNTIYVSAMRRSLWQFRFRLQDLKNGEQKSHGICVKDSAE